MPYFPLNELIFAWVDYRKAKKRQDLETTRKLQVRLGEALWSVISDFLIVVSAIFALFIYSYTGSALGLSDLQLIPLIPALLGCVLALGIFVKLDNTEEKFVDHFTKNKFNKKQTE